MSAFSEGWAVGAASSARKREGQQQFAQAQERSQMAWAQLAEQREEKFKREEQFGKSAEFFFKANPDALKELGISETQFKNMSANEQSAAAMGYVQSQTAKQVMQQLAQDKDDQAGYEAVRQAATTTQSVPSPSMPGVFPSLSVQSSGVPSREAVWSQFAQRPGALRSRVAQPFIQELAQGPGETPLGFTAGDLVDLGTMDPRLAGQFQVRQSRGSWQHVNTQPSASGRMPTDPKQRSYQNELTSALDDEAKAWQTLRAERPGSTRWDSLNQVYNAAKQRRTVAERRLTPASGASVPASQSAAAPAAVPPEHAAYLKAHPEKRASFEAMYGKEAAAAILDQ